MSHRPVKITTDSTCDLTAEQLTRFGLPVLPLYVTMDGQQFRDGLEAKPEDLYAYAARTGTLAQTSAPSVMDYLGFFGSLVEEGFDVVHMGIGSKLSVSMQNALIAAGQTEHVYVCDSANLSTGTSLQLIKAVEMAQSGASAAEIVLALGEMNQRVRSSFVLDTLEYMRKGGRCSSVAALGANLLRLKPTIEVVNGKLQVSKKYRGGLDKCLREYITDQLKDRKDLDLSRIFITHSGCDPKLVAELKTLIGELQPFEEILESVAGCTISVHCGPQCLGVLFMTKE